MVSSSLHLSHSNFRSNESPFSLLEPTWLVDDGGCYHSRNRGMQRSHKLSRSRYRRVDDADTPSSSPFGTDYAWGRAQIWARTSRNLSNPRSPTEPLLSSLDVIGDIG